MYSIDWRRLGMAIGILLTLLGLWLVFGVYNAGHPWMALGGLIALAGSGAVFTWPRAYAWRYMYPGVVAILIFIIFPALYTVRIGFTNYSSSNLLSYERATAYLLDQSYTGDGDALKMQLYPHGKHYQLVLHRDDGATWHSEDIDLVAKKHQAVAMVSGDAVQPTPPVEIRDLISLQPMLQELVLSVPGEKMPYRLSSLTSYTPAAPLYRQNADGTLTNLQNGQWVRPDFVSGFYRTQSGDKVEPGFRVDVGWKNFKQLFGSAALQAPLLRVFAWTVVFAALTVIFTFCIGFVLATTLSWESLKFRTGYRVLLFLPYAVPGFISILIFRGLFNENFGEINMVLHGLFGIRPNWFSDPFLAKSMLLIVNTWLGYPYMMLLCLGLIKSIPSDLYEASAIAGATAWQNLTRITLPLIMKPIMPLLIASFAFNFNNFVLISLLTDGRPDFTDSMVPAGTTDILVSYTYRIAFQDSGQNFGLAAAISTLIFLLVAALSVVNLKLMRVNAQDKR
jgi:maltose/maltodextrin transport system permease protein